MGENNRVDFSDLLPTRDFPPAQYVVGLAFPPCELWRWYKEAALVTRLLSTHSIVAFIFFFISAFAGLFVSASQC